MSNNQPVDIYGKPYNRTLLVVVLLIGTFCTVLNQTLLTTAFPTLMKAFDISASDAMVNDWFLASQRDYDPNNSMADQ